MDNITLLIYNDKKELANTIQDQEYIKKIFTELLFNKYIAKSKELKQVQYNYNYKDRQKVTFILCNGWRYILQNIPTQHGLLDIDKI